MADISKIKTLDGTTYDIKDAAAYRKPSGGIPSTDMTSVVQSSLALADSAVQPSVVSNEYDSTASYNVGDYCIYDGDFYKCNTAIATGGETWTAAHWTATNIDSELRFNTFYGVCSTDASTSVKIVDIPEFTDDSLVVGVTIHVKFLFNNTASYPSLKVGNCLTAKSITRTNGTPNWSMGTVISFTYDGYEWAVNREYSSSFTIDGVKSGTNSRITRYGVCYDSASTAAKTITGLGDGTIFYTLGSRITVNFLETNTAENPTLSIAGDTAKNVRYKGSNITTGPEIALLSGIVDLMYDGTGWTIISGISLPAPGVRMINSANKEAGMSFSLAGVDLDATNNDDNIDIGWKWTGVCGAGAAFRSSGTAVNRQNGVFVFYARNLDSNDNVVMSQLYGYPDGRFYWNINSTNTSIVSTLDETDLSVGDVATVSAIDSDGKPTRWKNRPAVLKFTKSNLSSLPYTFTDSDTNSPIDSRLEVVNYVLSNPSAQVNDWTITTADDHSITISGTINGTTNVTLYLSTPSRSLVD